jgi:hypothetical protein
MSKLAIEAARLLVHGLEVNQLSVTKRWKMGVGEGVSRIFESSRGGAVGAVESLPELIEESSFFPCVFRKSCQQPAHSRFTTPSRFGFKEHTFHRFIQ